MRDCVLLFSRAQRPGFHVGVSKRIFRAPLLSFLFQGALMYRKCQRSPHLDSESWGQCSYSYAPLKWYHIPIDPFKMLFQGAEKQGPIFNEAMFALIFVPWYSCTAEDALHLFQSDTLEGPIRCIFILDYTVVGCNCNKIYSFIENNH